MKFFDVYAKKFVLFGTILLRPEVHIINFDSKKNLIRNGFCNEAGFKEGSGN